MNVDKRCLGAFAKSKPLVALASRTSLFDQSQSHPNELMVINYLSGERYPGITSEEAFLSLLWCESQIRMFLVAGHDEGAISIYEHTEKGMEHLITRVCLSGEITALGCFSSENPVLVAGSSNGEILFWTLTNLSSEYKFETSITTRITSLACNQVYKKFLAVGIESGQVVIFDLKKKSQVLKLKSSDFRDPRRIFWDENDPTILHVMSEREFITSFNLKMDTSTKIATGCASPVLAFQNDIIVHSGWIYIGEKKIKTIEGTECVISPRDPVMIVVTSDGKTSLISIPVLKRPSGICFISGGVITGTNINNLKVHRRLNLSKFSFTSPTVSSVFEKFFSAIFEMLKRNADKSEIANQLIENYKDAEEKEDGYDVDLNDPEVQALINGNYNLLKKSNSNTKIKYLAAILDNDISVLEEIKDFKEALIFSRVLKNYVLLKNVKNPRILAGVLLKLNADDFSALRGTREANLWNAMFTNNLNKFLNARIASGSDYSSSMSLVEKALQEAQDLQKARGLESLEITSPYVVEYIWRSVALGMYDKVKSIKITDPYVSYYMKSAALSPKSSSLKSSSISQGVAKVSLSGNNMLSSGSLKSAKSVPSFNAASRQQPQASSAFSSHLSSIHSPQRMVEIQGIPTRRPSIQSAPYVAPQPSPVLKAPLPQPDSPLPQRQQQPFPVQTPREISRRMPARSPPSPPSISASSMSDIHRPVLSPTISHSASSFSRTPIPQPKSSPQISIRDSATDAVTTLPQASEIISKFDKMVKDLCEKANAKNSILITQKRAQCLRLLSVYDSQDKKLLSDSILFAMDALVMRLENPDSNLKYDVDLIARQEPACAWLRAVAELVKIVY